MAENVILVETTYDGFSANELYGAYTFDVNPAPFTLVAGETYTVLWDGVSYVCQAVDASAMQEGAVFMGSAPSVGLPGNGEPFAIGYSPSGVTYMSNGTESAHTVGIYLGTLEEEGIILRDHTGEAVVHGWPERLRVDTSDGGTTHFIHESLVAQPVEQTVELDFSGGDMVVTPDAGKAFSQVEIPIPANLTPGNIAEGVDIAGIVGEMVGGGGGVITTGTVYPTVGADFEIQHRLGVVPDFVFVFAINNVSSTFSTGMITSVYGMRQEFAAALNSYLIGAMFVNKYATVKAVGSWHYIENSDGIIHDANATSFKVGTSSVSLHTSKAYQWFAVAGLEPKT